MFEYLLRLADLHNSGPSRKKLTPVDIRGDRYVLEVIPRKDTPTSSRRLSITTVAKNYFKYTFHAVRSKYGVRGPVLLFRS